MFPVAKKRKPFGTITSTVKNVDSTEEVSGSSLLLGLDHSQTLPAGCLSTIRRRRTHSVFSSYKPQKSSVMRVMTQTDAEISDKENDDAANETDEDIGFSRFLPCKSTPSHSKTTTSLSTLGASGSRTALAKSRVREDATDSSVSRLPMDDTSLDAADDSMQSANGTLDADRSRSNASRKRRPTFDLTSALLKCDTLTRSRTRIRFPTKSKSRKRRRLTEGAPILSRSFSHASAEALDSMSQPASVSPFASVRRSTTKANASSSFLVQSQSFKSAARSRSRRGVHSNRFDLPHEYALRRKLVITSKSASFDWCLTEADSYEQCLAPLCAMEREVKDLMKLGINKILANFAKDTIYFEYPAPHSAFDCDDIRVQLHAFATVSGLKLFDQLDARKKQESQKKSASFSSKPTAATKAVSGSGFGASLSQSSLGSAGMQRRRRSSMLGTPAPFARSRSTLESATTGIGKHKTAIGGSLVAKSGSKKKVGGKSAAMYNGLWKRYRKACGLWLTAFQSLFGMFARRMVQTFYLVLPHMDCTMLFTWVEVFSEDGSKKKRFPRIVANNFHVVFLQLLETNGVEYTRLSDAKSKAAKGKKAKAKGDAAQKRSSSKKPKLKRSKRMAEETDALSAADDDDCDGDKENSGESKKSGHLDLDSETEDEKRDTKLKDTTEDTGFSIQQLQASGIRIRESETLASVSMDSAVRIEGNDKCKTAIIEGIANVRRFVDFWIRRFPATMNPVKRCKLIPKLFSYAPFLHSTASQTRVTKCVSGKDADFGSQHNLELEGVIFPHQWRRIVKVLTKTNSDFVLRSEFYALQQHLNHAMYHDSVPHLESKLGFGVISNSSVGVTRLKYDKNSPPLFVYYSN